MVGQGDMLQEIVGPAASGNLLIEEISNPIAALQLVDFCDVDDEVAGGGAGELFSSSEATNAVANGQEALCCYRVDAAAASAAFSFLPSLYALLDVPPPPPPDPEPDLSIYPSSSSSSGNLLPPPLPAVMFQVPPGPAMYLGDYFDPSMVAAMPSAGESAIGQQPQHLYEEPGYGPPEMAGLNSPSFEFLESIHATLYGGADTRELFGGAPACSFGHEALQQRLFGSGDLQVAGGCSHLQHPAVAGGSMRPLPTSDAVASSDDPTYKVGRLSVEERKQKIHRYMKKRNERNFSKKIKYACRKTLADSRPRVRGRFAKNDELGEAAAPRLMRPSAANEFDGDDDEMAEKEEAEEEEGGGGGGILYASDKLTRVSGVNLFQYDYTIVESWI